MASDDVRRFSSASSTASIVPAMLSPVSPSATGKTFEVVDLLPALLEMRVRHGDDAMEPLD